MAKTTSGKSSPRSARAKSSKKAAPTGFSALLAKFGSTNLAVACVFVVLFAGIGGYYLYHSYAATTVCTNKLVVRGNTGYCVQQLQNALQIENHYSPYRVKSPGTADGIFGTNTYNSVVSFQKSNFVSSRDWDGKVGPKTWNSLCNALSIQRQNERKGSTWYNRDLNAFNNLHC